MRNSETLTIKTCLEDVGNIEGNGLLVSQIILNLMLNSRDAGSTKVSVKLEKELRDEQELCCLSFKGDGMGISEDDLPNIFEPFYTSKEPDMGTGLGLAVVLFSVAEMNGTISVESEQGRGANFLLTFPSI